MYSQKNARVYWHNLVLLSVLTIVLVLLLTTQIISGSSISVNKKKARVQVDVITKKIVML